MQKFFESFLEESPSNHWKKPLKESLEESLNESVMESLEKYLLLEEFSKGFW